MKKLFAIFLTISMTLSMSLTAQPPAKVDIPHVIETPGLVLIPVYVDFSMMGAVDYACAFDFTINFNPGMLTSWNGVQNAPAGILTQTPTGPTLGQIKISWSNPGANLDLNGKLLDLAFYYAGGCTDLTFVIPADPRGITEVGDCAVQHPDGYPTNFINGSICEEIAPVPVASWPIYLAFGLIIMFMVVGIRKFV